MSAWEWKSKMFEVSEDGFFYGQDPADWLNEIEQELECVVTRVAMTTLPGNADNPALIYVAAQFEYI
jgi:hypothetical protein